MGNNSFQRRTPRRVPQEGFGPAPGFARNEDEQVTPQDIRIPNEFVGAIIGKGGRRIREIRDKSGSQIRIAEPDGSAERTLTVIGSSSSNQKALLMVYARLESEKMRMSQAASATATDEETGV
jgi:heterogeneous nuclear rnp K-like protein 2